MDISPTEAEEALAAIHAMARKTRHSIASGGTYITLIVTGVVWLVGFACTQFLDVKIIGFIWTGLAVFGGVVGVVWGARVGWRVRKPAITIAAKRIWIFWALLVFYTMAAIAIAWPLNGKQVTILIVLFTMIGHLSMGQLLSYTAVWWPLPITVLALAGYFFFPEIFFLWMAVLGGGGMILLGHYIRHRW